MRKKVKSFVQARNGMTLVELLVVILIIAILLAILGVGLRRSKESARRILCLLNLHQIELGWSNYFQDNQDRFLRGGNTNHTFGGWRGVSGSGGIRPLNFYINPDLDIDSDTPRTVFCCPADRGGVLGAPSAQPAYDFYGNSYQTNLFLVGPPQLPVPETDYKEFRIALNNLLRMHDPLSKSHITSSPASLIFVGDNNWWDQIEPSVPDGKEWHMRKTYFNVGFLDGHCGGILIPKNIMIGDNYSTIPFSELTKMASELQGKP